MIFGPSIAALGLLLLSLVQGWTANLRPQGVELRTGYGFARNDEKRPSGFQIHPVQVSLQVPLTDPMGPDWLRGRVEWNPEIYFAMLSHPYGRYMAGGSPLQFRYMVGPRGNWSLYGVGSMGVVHANIDRPETGSDFNFMLGLGVGARYALSGEVSLLFEYRRVHISNAGIDEQNKGIDSNNFLAGFSCKI